MAQIVSLTASTRQSTGKGAARQARFRGEIPAVIYGRGRDTQPLAVEAKALEKALTGVEPASTIIELAVDGKTVRTLIREIQRHPVRPDIIHVDFYEIHAAEKVKLKVPVHLVGAPDGVRNAGGVLDQVTREEEVEGEAAEGGPKAEPKGAAAPAKGAAPPAKGEKGEKPEKTEKPKGGKES